MSLNLKVGNTQRIEWIDVAKGIAILLVIIGHTVQFESLTWNLIFSFHMPVFFVLSGYTYRPAVDKKTLFNHAKHHFHHLILPCLYVSLFVVVCNIVKNDYYSISEIWFAIYSMLRNLFWASGVPFKGTAVSFIWFIFSLFWTKILIDCIYTFQKNQQKYCTIGCLTFLGVGLGTTHHWLVQNFDVTLVALVFFYIGMLWKTH